MPRTELGRPHPHPKLPTTMFIRMLIVLLGLAALAACAQAPAAPPTAAPAPSPTPNAAGADCPLSESVWVKPPEDAAVNDPPAFGYYYVNADRSIWASAWWTGQSEYRLRAAGEGNKVGWFRPAGATLDITGQRLDAPAPPLEAHASCCYPTRFQASGIYFPTGGCWEVTARADKSELTFVVWVEP